MGKAGFTVETWANGYGRWHAKVHIPNKVCFGPQVARAARRAIVAELRDRFGEVENVGVRFVEMTVTDGKTFAHYEECELAAK